MALTSEDLLAISQLMDVKMESILESKLQPIRDDIHFLKLRIENNIMPRLQSVEECCLSMGDDIHILKLRIEKDIMPRLQSVEECCLSMGDDIHFLKQQIENNIMPRLQSVEECCLSMGDDIHFLKLQNENDIMPRLQNIEECYLSTYDRYQNGVMQLDAMQADVDIMKNVVMKHSEKLKQLA